MSRNRSASTLALLAVLSLFAAGGAGWAIPIGQIGPIGLISPIAARARAVLADPRYQRGFPGLPPGVEPGLQGRSRRYPGDVVPGDVDPSPSLSGVPVSALSTFTVILMAAVVAAGVAWVLGLRRRSPGPAVPPGPPEEEAAAPRRRLLFGDDAERLAAEERWAEALHALLLQAIRALAARSPTPLPPSFTSRELLARAPLSGEARQAFAGLVRAVEGAWFGGLPVGPEDYRENRERCRRIAAEGG